MGVDDRLPVLGHLGYRALTSLPIGQVPGRPAGMARQRRNLQLRTRVVAFLNEVRRAESYAASTGGAPGEDYLEIWEFSVDWDTPANSTRLRRL